MNNGDQTGVYWSVKPQGGYHTATAFANLPNVSIRGTDFPYMIFSVHNTTQWGDDVIGDYGLLYENGWKLFAFAKKWEANGYVLVGGNPTKISLGNLQGGDRVYMKLQVLRLAGYDEVKLEIRDATTQNVLASAYRRFSPKPFAADFSTVTLGRHVTMAQSANGGTLNTSTGSYSVNANFSQAYLYNDAGYSQYLPANVLTAVRKAPTVAKLSTVVLNAYTPWHTDNVSIRFNQ